MALRQSCDGSASAKLSDYYRHRITGLASRRQRGDELSNYLGIDPRKPMHFGDACAEDELG